MDNVWWSLPSPSSPAGSRGPRPPRWPASRARFAAGRGVVAAATMAAALVSCMSSQEQDDLDLFKANAKSYYHGREYDRAIHQANKALEIDPDDVATHNLIAYSLFYKGFLDKANNEANNAVERFTRILDTLDGEDHRALLGLSMTYFQQARQCDLYRRFVETVDRAARDIERAAVAAASGAGTPAGPARDAEIAFRADMAARWPRLAAGLREMANHHQLVFSDDVLIPVPPPAAGDLPRLAAGDRLEFRRWAVTMDRLPYARLTEETPDTVTPTGAVAHAQAVRAAFDAA
ncbi:MAG: tetratricopeptide repeat protein, partial [Planctomycetes bacterium]|nr:tetratricopeptide repeat protein [Planctomycetota bacterium]